MRTIIIAILAALVGLTGCTTDTPNAPEKSEVQQGKDDGHDLCDWYGFEQDCDICREFGWYDDNVCDDFCDEVDPDCDVAVSNIRFECFGESSEIFFDLEIVDVGDQEGNVIVNDGGAPNTFSAHYDEFVDEHSIEHRSFIFGYDEHNEGLIDELYEIDITSVSYSFLKGTVDYDGYVDTIVCYDMETVDPEPSFDFDCLSIDNDTMFELTIVDVGDEEGTVVANDGGAPVTYSATYDEMPESNGYGAHSFIFGFDEYNEGSIEALYTIDIEERSATFATGLVEYGLDSSIVCYMP